MSFFDVVISLNITSETFITYMAFDSWVLCMNPHVSFQQLSSLESENVQIDQTPSMKFCFFFENIYDLWHIQHSNGRTFECIVR